MSKDIKWLPKWIGDYYLKLWDRFDIEDFTFQQAIEVVEKKHASVVLTDLRRNDWISSKLHPTDNRKRIYNCLINVERLN